MPKVLRDYEVYLVYVDADRCDSCKVKKANGSFKVKLAIGQASETAFCQDFCFLDVQGSFAVDRGLIAIDKDTQQTEMPGVFAGGDAANGPATVIEAIAAGRRAAISIDKYIGGDSELEFGKRNAEGEEGTRRRPIGRDYAAPKDAASGPASSPEGRGLRPRGNAEVNSPTMGDEKADLRS